MLLISGALTVMLVTASLVLLFFFMRDTQELKTEVASLIERNARMSEFEEVLGTKAEEVSKSDDGANSSQTVLLLKYEGLPPFAVLITINRKTSETVDARFR